MDDDGEVTVKVCRDARPRPVRQYANTTPDKPAKSVQLPAPISVSVRPWAEATHGGARTRQPPSSKAKAAREVAKRRKAEDMAATRRRVGEIAAASAGRPLSGPTGSDRISGVRERVLTRLAGDAG